MELKTALVVDDSKVARFGLIKILKRKGLQVDCAESGLEALDYLKNKIPDIIFMDYFMPGMDGPDATRAIRSNHDTALIPVIMCTSKESDQDKMDAREAGVDGFMIKPATQESLDTILRSIDKQPASNEDIGPTRGEQTVPTFDEASLRRLVETIAKQTAEHVATDVAKFHADIQARETAINTAQSVSTDIAKSVAHHAAESSAKEIAQETSVNAVKTLEDTLMSQWQQQFEAFTQSDEFHQLIIEITDVVAKDTAQQTAREIACNCADEMLDDKLRGHHVHTEAMVDSLVQNQFKTQRYINFVLLTMSLASLAAASVYHLL